MQTIQTNGKTKPLSRSLSISTIQSFAGSLLGRISSLPTATLPDTSTIELDPHKNSPSNLDSMNNYLTAELPNSVNDTLTPVIFYPTQVNGGDNRKPSIDPHSEQVFSESVDLFSPSDHIGGKIQLKRIAPEIEE